VLLYLRFHLFGAGAVLADALTLALRAGEGHLPFIIAIVTGKHIFACKGIGFGTSNMVSER
jgi:hypothetical protein